MTEKIGKEILKIYGISQNPNTNDYILVQKNYTWSSKNEKIDDYIQEVQLNIKNNDDVFFEWIPYNQFNEIKEINKDNFTTVYSAIWKDGPLNWDNRSKRYTRDPNKEIVLKYHLHNLQNPTEFLINEVLNF